MTFDEGLLSPLTVGHDQEVTDAAALDALVSAEVALVRALARLGIAPPETGDEVSSALGWRAGAHVDVDVDVAALAESAASGGNAVIPLVSMIKAQVPEAYRRWVHRGVTSQDILDTALMLVARRATIEIDGTLCEVGMALADFASRHRDEVAAARTLTQHAVPTTVGARAAGWLRSVLAARRRLSDVSEHLPAQLGGAGGTLASFVEIAGTEHARALPAAYAAELGLATPDAPWHTDRRPVTELGDALVQVLDALGKMASDVATLARTEIGELSEGAGGGSSAMPQKQNPVAAVLIRSAALRAPQLGATLHLASTLASDERPDGAWHAEWPTLRELLRLALGASASASGMIEGLRVDHNAVKRNLAATRGLIISERLSLVLGDRIGPERLATLVDAVRAGGDLAELVRALPESAGEDIDALVDPVGYTGLAGVFVDAARRRALDHEEPE